MAELQVSYPEISFLRELLQKEKFRIWHDEWAPRIKNENKLIELYKAWDEERFAGIPLANLDCCRLLQGKIENIEKMIQEDLVERPAKAR